MITIKIVVANSFEEYKLWCLEEGIDRKAEDCKYRYMINDYSVKGININEVIDITTKKTPDMIRLLGLARMAVVRNSIIVID